MRSYLFIAALMAAFVFSADLGVGRAAINNDEAAPVVQDDVEARLRKLEQRVDKLEAEKAVMELTVQSHKKLVKDIYAWMGSLPGAADKLAASMDQARQLGFTYAGANPKAKENVLDGVKDFADAMKDGNPAVKKSKN